MSSVTTSPKPPTPPKPPAKASPVRLARMARCFLCAKKLLHATDPKHLPEVRVTVAAASVNPETFNAHRACWNELVQKSKP